MIISKEAGIVIMSSEVAILDKVTISACRELANDFLDEGSKENRRTTAVVL